MWAQIQRSGTRFLSPAQPQPDSADLEAPLMTEQSHACRGIVVQSFGKGCVRTETPSCSPADPFESCRFPVSLRARPFPAESLGCVYGGGEVTLPLCYMSSHSAGHCVAGREGRVGISPLNRPHRARAGTKQRSSTDSFLLHYLPAPKRFILLKAVVGKTF